MKSQADLVRELPPEQLRALLDAMTDEEAEALSFDWEFWRRPEQGPPGEFEALRKTYWLVLAGRGFGKTRAGAEQAREWAKTTPLVNFIGATSDDVRDIMIEGESGILSVCPRGERPLYQSSKRRLLWPNGAISLLFTADEPERLRGKQHFKLWCDELAAWRYPESWDQAQLGLRLGDVPQAVVTTTPKPTTIVKELIADPECIVTRGSTYENKRNLAPAFVKKIITKYEGTRLGRQELNAEMLDDNPNALWTHAIIEQHRIKLKSLPALSRIVVGVDPAVTAKVDSNDTGIIAAGRDFQDPPHFYVMRDDTQEAAKPDVWGKQVIRTLTAVNGDMVIGEVNNGGDLVEANIRNQDENVPFTAVRASRGKVVRAEPVSALYEQGRVHHVGIFGALEDQMCEFNPQVEGDSPDRVDALVWAISDLADMEATDVVVVQDVNQTSIVPELDEADFYVQSSW